jgi:hypothetical protein
MTEDQPHEGPDRPISVNRALILERTFRDFADRHGPEHDHLKYKFFEVARMARHLAGLPPMKLHK